jgi:hypothetical protein
MTLPRSDVLDARGGHAAGDSRSCDDGRRLDCEPAGEKPSTARRGTADTRACADRPDADRRRSDSATRDHRHGRRRCGSLEPLEERN